MWPLTDKKKTRAKKTQNKKVQSKKTPVKRGEKQAQSLIRRRRLSSFIRASSVLAVCLCVISMIYVWKSGLFYEWIIETSDKVDREIADAGFVVEEVRITGQAQTSLKQVQVALALYDGQSIVSLDLKEMLARVEMLPWVKKATIMRIMPNALEVKITEHQAEAVWQREGKLYLIDRAGLVISDQGVEKFPNLPQVVGEGANENLADLLTMRDKYPDLFARVASSVWIGNRRWDINFQSGIKIKLPEKGADLAWDQLNEYQERQKILSKEVLVVDFRELGKTIIRLTPEEAKRRRAVTKTGKTEQAI